MSEPVQTIFAVLGTIFDMFATMVFYKTCLGNKNIRVNKFVFYIIYILAFGIGMALSQFGFAGLFYSIMSFFIFFRINFIIQLKMGCSYFFIIIKHSVWYDFGTYQLWNNHSNNEKHFK